MTEQWKDIPGYEGLYEVSSLGRVRSIDRQVIKTIKGKMLKPQLSTTKYHTVNLCKDGKAKMIFIHRLVAKAFLPGEKEQVNHKNGHIRDNSLENLEWNTPAENIKHAWDTGLINNRGENMGWSKLTQAQVSEIRAKYKKRKNQYTPGYSQYELAKEYGVSRGTIQSIISNKNWKE